MRSTPPSFPLRALTRARGETRWSDRGKRKEGRPSYFLVTGRAYPKVVRGKNATNQLSTDPNGPRELFYNDPATMLSEADLDDFNGTEGMPLCVEHDTDDSVGDVRLGWLNEGDLKITARIPMVGERNLKLVEEIKAGKWKGFSVGYAAKMSSTSPNSATRVDGKVFREVSLVEQPFFEDCHLAYGCIAASGKEATKNASYNPTECVTRSYYPIQMSATIPATNDATTPALGAPGGAPAGGNLLPNTGNPTAQAAVKPGELLLQTEQMKSALEDEVRARRTMEDKLAAFERVEAERRAKKEAKAAAAAEAKAKQDAIDLATRLREEAEYSVAQMPKFNAFVEALTASGAPPSEELKAGYRKIFTDPGQSSRNAAAHMEAQTTAMVNMQASAKTEAERAKRAEEKAEKEAAEKRAYEEVVQRSSHMLNHSRAHFAAALAAPTTPQGAALQAAAEDVNKRQVEAELRASGRDEFGGLMYIMVPMPSAIEQPVLEAHGYRNEAAVRASHKSDPYSTDQPYVTRLPAPGTHRQMFDKDRNLNMPASARHVNPAWFAFLCAKTDQLMSDLSDCTTINPGKNVIERKDADEWADRQFYRSQGAAPQNAAGGPQ